MDPLGWLGLKKARGRHNNLAAILEQVRRLLPDDEPVVLRYIVIVAVLLTRVAQSDGQVLTCEMEHLRLLFRHIDRMPPEGADLLCQTLNERVPELSDEELRLCYRELKSLCDAKERLQVIRLLASQATADGSVAPSEHSSLVAIAHALDVPVELIEDIEIDALSSQAPPATVVAERVPSRAGAKLT